MILVTCSANRRTSLPFVLVAVLLATVTLGQESPPKAPVLSKVAATMQGFVDTKDAAGIVTVVATDKAIVHSHAVGKSNLATGQALELDSIFWIASMSKPITGTCVLMMVEEGKLSLDDPITKYLPEMNALRTGDGQPVVITIRHLMTHTSGMSELKSDEAYTAKTLNEVAGRYAKLTVQFQPGSKWQYSQTGINTAARIVEVVSGKSFDNFVQERLFGPLGMNDTTFYLTDSQMKRLAKSYKKTSDGSLDEMAISLLAGKSPTDRDRFPAANGGLFSTVGDYTRFCQMLLNQGELDGQRVLSANGVKTLQTVASGDVVTGFTPGNGWGIGCCIVRNPQGVSARLSPGSFGHGGAYGTQAWIDPVKKRAYILMVQQSFPNSDDSIVRRAFQETAFLSLE